MSKRAICSRSWSPAWIILLAGLAATGPARAQVEIPLRVLVPKEGAVWRAGETRTLRWEPGPGETVRIRLAPTGNWIFFLIDAEAPNTGEYTWVVENATTARARIFITDNSTGVDGWSGTFTILNIPTPDSVGRLYFRADPGGSVDWVRVPAFQEFSWYLLTDIDFTRTGFDTAMWAWAAAVDLPPGLTITGAEHFPARSINASNLDHNWVVGLGECLGAEAMPAVILQYRAVLLEEAEELTVSLRPPTPGFIDPPDAPLWAGCGVGGGNWPYPETGLFTINPGPTASRARSWGAVKARF